MFLKHNMNSIIFF